MRGKAFWTEQLGEGWANVLKPVLKNPETEKLLNGLNFDYSFAEMFPKNKQDIFKPFKLCPWDSLKMVIIGTEPGPHTGKGALAFSDEGSYMNPSATEIRNCLERIYGHLDLGFDNTLEHWASQGILMLNRSLTAYDGRPKAHRQDWKQFFGMVLYAIEQHKPGTIFLLWGKEVQKYAELLSQNHHVFSWEHPMKAVVERRQWNCPNFKDVDTLTEKLYEDRFRWLTTQ